jgi:hypothetical protein
MDSSAAVIVILVRELPIKAFYVDATINRCAPAQTPCNSSPVLSNDPFAIICGGDNYVFNNGAIDPDLDSLTYSFAPALQAAGSSVTYLPPLAYDRPMPWTNGQADAPFPDGIHCDPENGDIMFTPPNGGGGLYFGSNDHSHQTMENNGCKWQ